MNNFEARVKFGFSPSMLFDAFTDPKKLFAAIENACHYPFYESFETYLPDDKTDRQYLIRLMKENEKTLHYNTLVDFQLAGDCYPMSDDPKVRAHALEEAKKHLNYAAEAESPLYVCTGSADQGEEKRPELNKRYEEFFLQICDYARQFNIDIALEPIERHRFKKNHLGPTNECADFIEKMRAQGAGNAYLMLDTAHLPLMEESIDFALDASRKVGLRLVHMGEAVLIPGHRFYGHTHPPIGVQSGLFDFDVQVEHFKKFFEFGYIPKEAGQERARMSLEVKAYPGCSEYTSIMLMYEKMKNACDKAAHELGIY